jgi:hypothetical protein
LLAFISATKAQKIDRWEENQNTVEIFRQNLGFGLCLSHALFSARIFICKNFLGETLNAKIFH